MTKAKALAPTVDELNETYERGQLVILAANVAEALRLTEAEARKKAKADAEALLEAAGFSPAEIFMNMAEKKPKGEKTPAPIKYRDEQGNTWAGKGKRPAWVVSYLEAGGDLETLKV